MPLSALPPEVVEHILIESVKARGIGRASRLRLVSRSWAAAVLQAIFASGVLDGEQLLQYHSENFFRTRYLAYRVLGLRRQTRPLRIVRRVAERIVAHRRGEGRVRGGGDAELVELADCVRELCTIPHIARNYGFSHEPEEWLAEAPEESIEEDDMQFQQALLTGAAWMNEISLVEQTLPQFRDCLYLVSYDGWGGQHRFELIFGSPVSMTAYRGNTQVLKMLIQALEASDRHHQHEGNILRLGASGGHVPVVDLVLKSQYDSFHPALVEALQQAKNVDMFKRLLPLARDHLQMEDRQKPTHYEDRFLPGQMNRAARAGDLALVEYLLSLGTKPSARWFKAGDERRGPVYAASRHGHRDVVDRLLREGFPFSQGSLEAAFRNGNADTIDEVVRVALETPEKYSLLPPLLVAVEKENQRAIKLLLSVAETRLGADARFQALQKAKELGLESMARYLEELG